MVYQNTGGTTFIFEQDQRNVSEEVYSSLHNFQNAMNYIEYSLFFSEKSVDCLS